MEKLTVLEECMIAKISKLFYKTLILLGILAGILLLVFFMSPLTPIKAVGGSMTGKENPNFINYAWESNNLDLQHGDIITFTPLDAGIESSLKKYVKNLSELENERFLKRIIAMEGDTIEIKNGILILNGEEIVEDYTIDHYSGENMKKIKIPKGRVFVAGDYRHNSIDSRMLGPIENNSITSEVIIYNVKFINSITDGLYKMLVKLGVE